MPMVRHRWIRRWRSTRSSPTAIRQKHWAVSRLRLHKSVNNVTPVTHASWRDKTSTYVVLTDDHAWPEAAQRRLAAQATEQCEMPTSHSPFLSRPAELAVLLRDVVARVSGGVCG
jgi:hypothetical protein